MGQISITIQNRTYRLNCGDGEESRLLQLSEYVRTKAQKLVDEHGRISDEHLMLMSAILIADELWDERGVDALAADLSNGDATTGNILDDSDKDAGSTAKTAKVSAPAA